MEDKIKKITSELLSKVGVDAQTEVAIDKSNGQEAFMVSIDAPKEAGLLIGAHGTTLHAIQSFIAMAIKQETGEWARVVLDVGDWRQKHEEHLTSLAMAAAERARTTGETQPLYNLTPSQRRIVHMALSSQDDIVTESQGEGASRYLVIKLA